MFNVTVLCENSVRRRALKAEHGLSLWIEADNQLLLFDTGQSAVYLDNAANLGIDIRKADHIILSHGHYDHGNGLRFFPFEQANQKLILHVHPHAFSERYAGSSDSNKRPVGFNWQLADLTVRSDRIDWTDSSAYLTEQTQLHTVCEKPCETVSPRFLIKQDNLQKKDYFLDEQILISRQPDGLVIICGCCHSGFIQMMNRVNERYPGEPIHAIIGGFHLGSATNAQMEEIEMLLKSITWNYLVPMHCTGRQAWCRLRSVFGEKCLLFETGDVLTI